MKEIVHGLGSHFDRYYAPVQRVDKPWGYELIYAVTECYCGKRLFVRAGQALSLQYHERKDETLYLEDGMAEVGIGADADSLSTVVVRPGVAFHVKAGTVHRLRAIKDSVFLEVSTSELDDVVRLEDRYGRV